jgi:hypothetical protein
MEIVYDSSVLTTEIKYQYIDGKPTIPTLPPQITLTEARAGIVDFVIVNIKSSI